jgi:hypothetical protein
MCVVGLALLMPACGSKSAKKTPFEQAKEMVLGFDHLSLSKVLSTNKVLVSERDPWDKSTLLHVACASAQNLELVTVLLKYGAYPNALDDLGRTPLHNAYKFGAPPVIIDLLLKHGAKNDIKDGSGKVPSEYLVR